MTRRTRSNQISGGSSPSKDAIPDNSSAPGAEEVEQSAPTCDSSKFAPINGDENGKPAPGNGKELEDEIVVGTRAKKAALGLETAESAAEQAKVSTNATAEDEPGVRVSKRKRVSRFSLQEGDSEEEELPPSSRGMRSRPNPRENREKTMEAQREMSADGEEPVTRRRSLNDVSQKDKVTKDPMVPLDAPIRPASRHQRKKSRYSSHVSPTTPSVNTSDEEMSDAPTADKSPTAATMAAAPQKEAKGPSVSDRTKIVLGYWKHSSEKDAADKHAVVGVLGNNNQLRPRLVKESRYGRPVIGNHPPGAGGVWRNWDEIEFEPHIRHLTRTQLKEYVRVRQQQKEAGETPQAEEANQIKAVKHAEAAVEAGDQPAVADFVEPAAAPKKTAAPADPDAAKTTPQKRGPRARLSSVLLKEANRPKRTPTVEQLNARAQQHVANAEVIQQRRNNQRASTATAAAAAAASASAPSPSLSTAASSPAAPPLPVPARAANPSANANRRVLDQALGGMQRNWAAQAEAAARDGVDDARVYLGTRYEFKSSGDFQGMYATHSTVITIGDEEFVENRVLRKVGRRYSN